MRQCAKGDGGHYGAGHGTRATPRDAAWGRWTVLGMALVGVVATAVPATVRSAEAALQEVVVTAQRREESVQDVPISITAYAQEQMDMQGMRSVDDMVRVAPGISFGRSTFGTSLVSSISIRGISSGAGAATTGVYIDETPIQVRATIASGNFSGNAYPRLFDLERVEVLRGPQGTLFGAGAEGGAIRFITPQPSLTERSLYVRTEYGQTEGGAPSSEAGIALGGPLIADRLGIRVSVSKREDGGYIDRVSYEGGRIVDKNANRADNLVARVALAFAPTDNLLITPSILHQRIDVNDTDVIWLPSETPSFSQPLTDWDDHRYENGQRVRQYGIQDLTLAALKIDWQLGAVDLISNTSYYDRGDRSVTDFTNFETPLWTFIFTGTPVTIPADLSWIAPGTDRQKNQYFTQELRLQSSDPDARLRWVVGGFYSDQDVFTGRRVENLFLPVILSDITGGFCQPDCYAFFFGVPAVDGKYIFIGETSTNDKQWAGFGQLDFDITEHLTATLGLRYAKMDFDFANLADGPVNGPPAPRTDRGENSESAVTPRFGLSYRSDSGNHYYATAAKGFRPGGANAPLRNPACLPDLAELGLSEVPTTYDSDSLWSYELGAKLSLAGGRARIDASGFVVDWDNIINNVSLDCILSFTTNLGQARSQGVDVDMQFQPTDNLLLQLALGYTDSHYTKTINPLLPNGSPNTAIELVGDGDALIGSAITGHAAIQYGFRGFGDEDGYARLDFSYQGENDDTALFNPRSVSYSPNSLFRDPSYHQLDLRWGQNFGGWDVSLFVRNLTNEDPVLGKGRTFAAAPLLTASTLRPRTFGVTAMYRR